MKKRKIAFHITGGPAMCFQPRGMFRAEIIVPHNADYYRTVQPILRVKVGGVTFVSSYGLSSPVSEFLNNSR